MFPQGFKRNYSGTRGNIDDSGMKRGLVIWLVLAIVLIAAFKLIDAALVSSASTDALSAGAPTEYHGYHGLMSST